MPIVEPKNNNNPKSGDDLNAQYIPLYIWQFLLLGLRGSQSNLSVSSSVSRHRLDDTVCPRSSDPFYIVTYYIKWGHYFLDTRYKKEKNPKDQQILYRYHTGNEGKEQREAEQKSIKNFLKKFFLNVVIKKKVVDLEPKLTYKI